MMTNSENTAAFCASCGEPQAGTERFCARCKFAQRSDQTVSPTSSTQLKRTEVIGLVFMAIAALVVTLVLTSTTNPSHRDSFRDEQNTFPAPRSVASKQSSIAGPAPEGNSMAVAESVIKDNFELSDCPAVTGAQNLSDGSIKAACSNGEAFRVFTIQGKTNCPEMLRSSKGRYLGLLMSSAHVRSTLSQL